MKSGKNPLFLKKRERKFYGDDVIVQGVWLCLLSELAHRSRSSLPSKDQCSNAGLGYPQNSITKTSLGDEDPWTLEPKTLMLTVGDQDAVLNFKKVQITNYTDSNLNFDLVWPGHFITVTPEQGVVGPNHSFSSENLNYHGLDVRIQIHCDSDMLDTRPSEMTTGVSQYNSRQLITPLIAVATPNSKNSANHLRVTQQKLDFQDVPIQHTAEQCVEIRNICSNPVRWHISSLVPPYIKISVSFLPRERGHYSQFWEIRSEVIDSSDYKESLSHTCKLELQGRTYKSISLSFKRSLAVDRPMVTPPLTLNSGKVMCKARELTLSTGSVHFIVNKPGTQQEQKIRIGNRAKEEMQKFWSFRPRHYLSYPILFRPRSDGHFQATLSLQKPSGEILTVQLTGVCSEQ
ncbi:hypothetical protein LSH36_230g01008 [Paralvinella palmiformis]|uniref:Centrosomal protein of 192 kDa-like n=1 Tax=Paralvinella palmiformis TaxID=53620 RepID=A0AAD9JMQ3_9ANNE|nr:hypothetical protein LSH36_230g01008 [Paralvinella palmiformis]